MIIHEPYYLLNFVFLENL